MKMRTPATPLITHDPYFSIWSMSDHLNGDVTLHWTGAPHSITGEIEADGKRYRFMGLSEAEPMEQLLSDVRALSSRYQFRCPEFDLEVMFLSPLLLDDLVVLARPITYLSIRIIESRCPLQQITAIITADDAICLSKKGGDDTSCTQLTDTYLVGGRVGKSNQDILNSSGDLICMDWGYLYLATQQKSAVFTSLNGKNHNGTSFHHLRLTVPLDVKGSEFVASFAYDSIHALEYFQQPLELLWKKEAASMEILLRKALSEYDQIFIRCHAFEQSLQKEAQEAGGEYYAELLALAYRQSIASHMLCEDNAGRLLFISKECGSGGCAATVDVSYPSIPLFLMYQPKLVEAMMRPIFYYANTPVWCYEYAPHDVGFYPLLNGQTYSNGTDPDRQMPIEECGNMLIMTAAAALAQEDLTFAKEHWTLLEKWCQYLLEHGYDPGNQLCTDDFAGHMAHNCNLSLKALLGIASFGILCGMDGQSEKEHALFETAQEMASQWLMDARNPDGTFRLAFDQEDTYSLKYNAIWDRLFEINLFPDQAFDAEIVSYLEKRMNRYGVPLDSRENYTKSDWILWSASMFTDQERFIRMITPVWDAYNESKTRCPMGDWYYTSTAVAREFQNRSVQGGLFIRLLQKRRTCSYVLHRNCRNPIINISQQASTSGTNILTEQVR